MNPAKNNVSGSVKISEDVISKIAILTVSEIDGVYSLAQSNAGIKELAFRSDAKSPVKISLNGGVAQINISVMLKLGYKVKNICEKIQESVKDSVQNMTGVTVSKVNIYVAGVKISE